MRRYRFLRSRKRIEIDITWQCNLTCFDCNRCCGEAPTTERMSVDQIARFIAESKRCGNPWRVIRVLGGEPTVHPDFTEIMHLLIDYKRSLHNTDEDFGLVVYTNGLTEKSLQLVDDLAAEVEVINTMKERGQVRHIGHFMASPVDLRDPVDDDFTMACTQATACGIGLTPYGYYQCPIAGSIDRIFGRNLGRQSLPDKSDDMFDLMKEFCKHCGFFDMDDESVFVSHENTTLLTERPIVTESWERALGAIKNSGKNILTRY